MDSHVVDKVITIDVMKHHKTGILIATSPDIRGLFVHGDTDDELLERVPVAIKALFQADGHDNIEVVQAETVPVAAADKLAPVTRHRFELRKVA